MERVAPITSSCLRTGRSPKAAWGVVICFCLALLTLNVPAWAASVEARLDRPTMAIGEQATVSLVFKDFDPGGAPRLPTIPGANLVFQGKSSQFELVNGQASQSVTFNYALVPTREGTVTIPALNFRAGADSVSTQPLTIKVEKPTPLTPEQQAQARQAAFLVLVVPKPEMYVGETVPARMDLYLRGDVANVSDFQVADFPQEGFTGGKQTQAATRQARVGNAVFNVLPLVFPLTALKPGEWKLGPVTASVVVHVQAQRGRDMFGMFFNQTVPQRVSLAASEVAIRVLPLPTDNRPASFNGAIGTYSLESSAGPTNIAVGDPITVKLALTGEGLIEQLPSPDLSGWRDFKVYPPTSKVESPDTALGLQGTKRFEVVVTPQSTAVKELPPVSFSFFDPAARQYRILTAPAVPLTVRPAGASPGPSVSLPGINKPAALPTLDIQPIKQRFGQLQPVGQPWVRQPSFLALQMVPVVVWLAALGWRMRSESLARTPRLRRRREVEQWLRANLPDLSAHAAAGRSEDFFGLLFRILQERLGERLDVPASAITEAVLTEAAGVRSWPEDLRASLQELFHRINEARYAPVRDSQELTSLIPKLEGVLRQLEALKS